MKKLLISSSTLLVATPIVAMVSCAESEDLSKTIAVIVSQQSNPFFQQIIDSAKAEAEKQGYKIKEFNSEDDHAKETANIDTVITKGYAGVVWNPMSSTGSKAAGLTLKNSGIPFTLVDRTIDDFSGNIAAISTDNIKATENVVAQALAKLLDYNSEIGEIIAANLKGVSGAAATIDRDQGFQNALGTWNGAHENNLLDVTDREDYADFDTAKAQEKVSNWKTLTTLEFIFAANDQMALGAAKAYEADSTYPLIVGFDGLDTAKTKIDEGKIYATVEQDTTKMGATSIQIIIEYLTKNNDLTNLSDYTKIDQSIALDGIIYKNDNWPAAKN